MDISDDQVGQGGPRAWLVRRRGLPGLDRRLEDAGRGGQLPSGTENF